MLKECLENRWKISKGILRENLVEILGRIPRVLVEETAGEPLEKLQRRFSDKFLEEFLILLETTGTL